MRLDLFLRKVGIIKRRTEAARLLKEGRILVDDRPAKPAAEVRPGQRLKISGPRGVTRWEILEIPAGNVPKSESERYARETS